MATRKKSKRKSTKTVVKVVYRTKPAKKRRTRKKSLLEKLLG